MLSFYTVSGAEIGIRASYLFHSFDKQGTSKGSEWFYKTFSQYQNSVKPHESLISQN